MGSSYAIFASVIWASAALIVKKEIVGFAYGLMQSFVNVTLVISPIIVGKIFESYRSYGMVNKRIISFLDYELFHFNHNFSDFLKCFAYNRE